MNKTIILFLIISIITFTKAISQDVKTKASEFISDYGIIAKFEDFNLPNLKTDYAILDVRIRKIKSGNDEKSFLQISKAGKYGSNIASIPIEKIIEVKKVIKVLKAQSLSDVISRSDHLENSFTSLDGFKIGYYVRKDKLVWFVKLEENSGESSVFFKEIEKLEEALNNAIEKTNQIK